MIDFDFLGEESIDGATDACTVVRRFIFKIVNKLLLIHIYIITYKFIAG